MIEDPIAGIGIDNQERLWVKPSTISFNMIFRSGMEVHWDDEHKRLFAPKPREWSYLRWFQQILAAAANEYAVVLTIKPTTIWSNVPNELKADIEQSIGRERHAPGQARGDGVE